MSDALTHLNRAIRAHATGSLEEAKYFYKKTLIEDPQNATALGWLGSIEAQHKNYDVAKDLLLKAFFTYSLTIILSSEKHHLAKFSFELKSVTKYSSKFLNSIFSFENKSNLGKNL